MENSILTHLINFASITIEWWIFQILFDFLTSIFIAFIFLIIRIQLGRSIIHRSFVCWMIWAPIGHIIISFSRSFSIKLFMIQRNIFHLISLGKSSALYLNSQNYTFSWNFRSTFFSIQTSNIFFRFLLSHL